MCLNVKKTCPLSHTVRTCSTSIHPSLWTLRFSTPSGPLIGQLSRARAGTAHCVTTSSFAGIGAGNTAEGRDGVVVTSQRPDSLFKGTVSENGLIKGFDTRYNQMNMEILLSTVWPLKLFLGCFLLKQSHIFLWPHHHRSHILVKYILYKYVDYDGREQGPQKSKED